jgi:cytoskeletal protein CcmA (bactofilin family)
MLENTFKRPTDEVGLNGCAYLGEGIVFKGSISVSEKVIVHGTLEGDIECRELIIGPKGMVKGNVRVDQADVYGKLFERAEIKRFLIVRKTGRIEGTVAYREIEIEKGGVIAGEFSMSGVNGDIQSDTQLEQTSDPHPRSRPRIVAMEPVWSDTVAKQAMG